MNNEEMYQLADELDFMQARHNCGRGIDCVRTLVRCLDMNNFDEACAVASNEWDKISGYKDIASLLTKKGLFTPIKF